MPDLFDYDPEKAKADRDEALARVAVHAGPWMPMALARLRLYPFGTEGIFEWFRFDMLRNGLPQPHTPHAWGSLCRTAISRRILVKTGRRAKMRGPKSHARDSDILRRA